MLYLTANFAVKTGTTADQKPPFFSPGFHNTVMDTGRFAGEDQIQSFLRIPGNVGSFGKIIAGTGGNQAQGDTVGITDPVYYFVHGAVSADHQNRAGNMSSGQHMGNFFCMPCMVRFVQGICNVTDFELRQNHTADIPALGTLAFGIKNNMVHTFLHKIIFILPSYQYLPGDTRSKSDIY